MTIHTIDLYNDGQQRLPAAIPISCEGNHGFLIPFRKKGAKDNHVIGSGFHIGGTEPMVSSLGLQPRSLHWAADNMKIMSGDQLAHLMAPRILPV